MDTLLTGGTGFIGRALCEALLARGDRVTVLSRDPAGVRALMPETVTLVQNLAEVERPPQAVVNLAGESLGAGRWNAARKQGFMDSRVGTTRKLVQWMRTLPAPPKVLLSGSAVGYYGARGEEVLSEKSPPAGEYQSRLCQAWETEARTAEALGVRVCRLRIGVVLGAGGGALAAMHLPFRLGLGGPLGHGSQWMAWIHRSDLVAMMLWLLDEPRRVGAYNAVAPNPVRNREFARALGAALRRPAFLPMPAPVLRLMVGEMAQLLLTGQKVVPARARAEGFPFRFPELAAALADIYLR